MDLQAALHSYGYLALAVGTYFEGEIALAVGGCAARSGLLSLPAVLLVGGIGVLASDWTCFIIGRCGRNLLRRWLPGAHARAAAAVSLVERHPTWFVLGFQFVPGTSTVTPIAIGMSRVPILRFLILDLIGVACWTLCFGMLGYLFGSAVVANLGGIHATAGWCAAAALLLGFGLWWVRRHVFQPTS